MKTKRMKSVSCPAFLGEETLSFWGRTKIGRVMRRQWSGQIRGESPMTFCIRLPLLDAPCFLQTQAFLEAVRDRYLCFLQKQSEIPHAEKNFGGMDFEFRENLLILKAGFSSFEEKQMLPCAYLLLSEKGELLKVARKDPARGSFSRQKKRGGR